MSRFQDLLELEKSPAADIKVKGWPSLMRKVRSHGAVVITNHNHPEAVVVDAEEYRRLVNQASAAAATSARAQSLQALQAKFDAHLAVTEGAGLAKAIATPARRGRKVALGPSL
ncbi:type II toxin-antitoxin system prevent-host-death family antitoxin [Xanthomonas citri]|uniref:type II toxin-antitoxin system prevent-host-death family antitoxin n=1 Tax=Xanthomonas citri TaxID=346 RepID=UPI000247C9A8|nr:type II toxin-antitoxin system prevent-host-death family antitoxin [Xanthomonas citri]OOX19346.1 prevent-host-death protein [Xanthomonas campestris pv. azadirachtae]CEJ42961.1 Prevent-host-death family protein [Xanthomonas citri pv. bilvae]MBE0314963.1 type II toxin-antitoxin system prevent-host-death family antitoxin [Xanthomonas citri pv. punicae]MDS0761515.1 type II toxin-antitoxin system prevent-host-death family antitoxin [Xanthomonas citri pv. punicae]MDS0765296.1 type II toxin-antito